MTPTRQSTKRTDAAADQFTAQEKAAMKERAKELKRSASAAEDEQAVLDKIATMPDADRQLATRIHALIKATAPQLTAKLWFGMPAYYKDGKSICFFQDANKFKVRYSTLGFNESANLDDGKMWPTSYALTGLTVAEETRITDLIKQAVG